MTYAGAEGQTRDEMAQVLRLDPELPEEKLHAEVAELLAALEYHDEEAGSGLQIANRLWAQQGFTFLPEFVQLTREQYGAEMGLADFAGNAESARREINAWVEEQTAEKIQELFPSGSLDGALPRGAGSGSAGAAHAPTATVPLCRAGGLAGAGDALFVQLKHLDAGAFAQ